MVWTDLDNLEYYHSNPVWGCYADPVFQPRDILLQAPINADATLGVVYAINICEPDGTFLENANSYFDVCIKTFTISGNTYYVFNLRCNNYSPAMLSNRCFVIRLVMTIGSSIVFNQFTQRYQLFNTSVAADDVTIDDGETSSVLPECVPAPSPELCGKNYIKLSWSFDCIDSYTGEFYGDGDTIMSAGDAPFNFTKRTWIEGRIRQVPRETKRTISINCRTQRTETTKQYLVVGDAYGGFPTWKMDEIEGMLAANHLYVNDTEYQSEGGTIFEQFGEPKGCQYRYKLNMKLQACKQWQIFGCVPSCEALATFYPLSRAYERIYDDNQRLVATDSAELLIYFESLPGTSAAELLPFSLPCPNAELYKVQSSGVLPKFLYLDEIVPAAKSYPKQLPAGTLDFTPLCNGVTNNNQVPVPELGVIQTEQIVVAVPQLGDIQTGDVFQAVLSVDNVVGWTVNPNYTSGVDNFGEVTLNISVSSMSVAEPYLNSVIAQISQEGWPNSSVNIYGTNNANLPDDAILTVDPSGQVSWTGNATNITLGPTTYYIEFFTVKFNKNN